MLRRTLLVLSLALPSAAGAQGAPPSTDIWLAPLSVHGDSVIVGRPRNVTRRDGYDNQPSFTPDSKAFLYTANVGGQTDIFRHEIASGHTSRVTDTPESEYSPTVMPGGRRFSVVRVERDSTQRLWSFALDGRDPRLVLPGVKPVGYHAWIDDSTVALFVLGAPSTLQVAHLRTGTTDTLARQIGRGVQAVGSGRAAAILFVQRDSAGRATIERQPVSLLPMKPEEKTIYVPAPRRRALPGTTEFFVQTPRGDVLAASGDTLYRETAAGFVPLRALARFGLRSATRLAVSPDGRWLAIVAEPALAPVVPGR